MVGLMEKDVSRELNDRPEGEGLLGPARQQRNYFDRGDKCPELLCPWTQGRLGFWLA